MTGDSDESQEIATGTTGEGNYRICEKRHYLLQNTMKPLTMVVDSGTAVCELTQDLSSFGGSCRRRGFETGKSILRMHLNSCGLS